MVDVDLILSDSSLLRRNTIIDFLCQKFPIQMQVGVKYLAAFTSLLFLTLKWHILYY